MECAWRACYSELTVESAWGACYSELTASSCPHFTTHCLSVGFRGLCVMSDLQAAIECQVELGTFYNVDLFQRG